MNVETRLHLYIYTLQHFEDFPNTTTYELFPEPYFNESERKDILNKIGDKLDSVIKNKVEQNKHICTAHDIAPIIIREFNIKKSKITKKDVKRFLKNK
jgi:hypothetical protein